MKDTKYEQTHSRLAIQVSGYILAYRHRHEVLHVTTVNGVYSSLDCMLSVRMDSSTLSFVVIIFLVSLALYFARLDAIAYNTPASTPARKARS